VFHSLSFLFFLNDIQSVILFVLSYFFFVFHIFSIVFAIFLHKIQVTPNQKNHTFLGRGFFDILLECFELPLLN
jgi:hypothetical protein